MSSIKPETWFMPKSARLFTERGHLWLRCGKSPLLKVCDSDGRLGCELDLDFTKAKCGRIRGIGHEVCLTCDFRDEVKDLPAYRIVCTQLLCYSRHDQSQLAIDLVPLDSAR